MQSLSTTRRLVGLAAAATLLSARPARATQAAMAAPEKPAGAARILLTGDVMLGEPRHRRRRPAARRPPHAAANRSPSLPAPLSPASGRGVDQALPFHCSPELYEGAVRDARTYTQLAVAANGPLPQHRPPEYPWGCALSDMEVRRAGRVCEPGWLQKEQARVQAQAQARGRSGHLTGLPSWRLSRRPLPPPPLTRRGRQARAPDARIINLETAVTTHAEPWPRKGINYRMHPGAAACDAVMRWRAGGRRTGRWRAAPAGLRTPTCQLASSAPGGASAAASSAPTPPRRRSDPITPQATFPRWRRRGWTWLCLPTTTRPTGGAPAWWRRWTRCRARVGAGARQRACWTACLQACQRTGCQPASQPAACVPLCLSAPHLGCDLSACSHAPTQTPPPAPPHPSARHSDRGGGAGPARSRGARGRAPAARRRRPPRPPAGVGRGAREQRRAGGVGGRAGQARRSVGRLLGGGRAASGGLGGGAQAAGRPGAGVW